MGSCFGIFFSGEDTGTGQTMQTVVREINEDYENQLDTIKDNITYDVLEMSGSRAVWPEVLSVYAVKTTTDPDNAMDVATVDDSRKAILKAIFWQMNEISSRTETNSETVIEETDDGHGNIVETSTTVTRTTLYITVSHKTAEEMAEQLGFTADQRAQLAELLADENNSLWAAVLYGIGVSDDAIVAVALWVQFPCGMVRLLRELVCQRVRLHRHWCDSEICRLYQRRPVVQRPWAMGR